MYTITVQPLALRLKYLATLQRKNHQQDKCLYRTMVYIVTTEG